MRFKFTQKNKISALLAGLSFAVVNYVPTAQAGFVSYTDAAAWNNAGAVSGTEDFNAFVPNTIFNNKAFVANNMHIQVTTAKYYLSIGTPNLSLTIDGTPYVMVMLENPDYMRIDFDTAVSAWGASFNNFGNIEGNTTIKAFDHHDNLLGTIKSEVDNRNKSFHGFALTANEAAAYLLIQNHTNILDTFTLDNVQYVTPSSVPLPPSLALFATGLLGLVGLGRKKLS